MGVHGNCMSGSLCAKDRRRHSFPFPHYGENFLNLSKDYECYEAYVPTLDSGIEIGQEINVGPGKFCKKNQRRALNKHK